MPKKRSRGQFGDLPDRTNNTNGRRLSGQGKKIMTQVIEAFVEIVDDMGAEISVTSKPTECPGLGGWKFNGEAGIYWVRIKGAQAAQFKPHLHQLIDIEISDNHAKVIE